MTTALEAYLTGVIHVAVVESMSPSMRSNLRVEPVTDDQGQINGIINVLNPDGRVRVTIVTTEWT